MGYEVGDVTWLLDEWVHHTVGAGEYLTWRRLAGRYPGKSNLKWLWGLVAAAVADGYLTVVDGSGPQPDPDTRVNWDRWQLTPKGQQLVDGGEPPAPQ